MTQCWYCQTEMIWDSDFNLDEVTGDESDQGIATYLHCPHCGATAEFRRSDDD